MARRPFEASPDREARDVSQMTDAELEAVVDQEKAEAAARKRTRDDAEADMSRHLDRAEAALARGAEHGRAADAALARARAGAPAVIVNAPPPDTRPPLSADQVAAQLGLHRAEVMDLIRSGKLPAKRVGSGTFVTAANLAAYVEKTDPPSAFPRFQPGDAVVCLTAESTLAFGHVVRENADGSVLVRHERNWFSPIDAMYPRTQVQPFTMRVVN